MLLCCITHITLFESCVFAIVVLSLFSPALFSFEWYMDCITFLSSTTERVAIVGSPRIEVDLHKEALISKPLIEMIHKCFAHKVMEQILLIC